MTIKGGGFLTSTKNSEPAKDDLIHFARFAFPNTRKRANNNIIIDALAIVLGANTSGFFA